MHRLPLRAANRLLTVLEDLGIAADVHEGYGIALVSVWVDLVVWTDGASFSWWSGRISQRTGLREHAYCPADDPVTAARRIADRYAELRDEHPLSELIREVLSEIPSRRMGLPV
ncbi:hypothetical protein Misp02_35490 [Microtetraspora sp. NBRC 16547]|nr:hypothetical protein Misp02_35490 [Microtetraspora sp. NBRC 16547]